MGRAAVGLRPQQAWPCLARRHTQGAVQRRSTTTAHDSQAIHKHKCLLAPPTHRRWARRGSPKSCPWLALQCGVPGHRAQQAQRRRQALRRRHGARRRRGRRQGRVPQSRQRGRRWRPHRKSPAAAPAPAAAARRMQAPAAGAIRAAQQEPVPRPPASQSRCQRRQVREQRLLGQRPGRPQTDWRSPQLGPGQAQQAQPAHRQTGWQTGLLGLTWQRALRAQRAHQS